MQELNRYPKCTGFKSMQFITQYSAEVYGPLAKMQASPVNPLNSPKDIGIIILTLEMRKPRLRNLMAFQKIIQQVDGRTWTTLCSASLHGS